MAGRSTNWFTRVASTSGIKLAVAVACLLMLIPSNGWAQAGALSGQVVTPFGGPAVSAKVLICPIGSTGVPCFPTATLYSDFALSHQVPNPISTDQYGNYKIFTTSGTYNIQVALAGNNQPTYIYYETTGGAGATSLCGPLAGDATSTNCGTGNLSSPFTPPAYSQAYGDNNLNVPLAPNMQAVGDNNLNNASLTGSLTADFTAIGSGNFSTFTLGNDSGSWIAVGNDNATNVTLGTNSNSWVLAGNNNAHIVTGGNGISDMVLVGDSNGHNIAYQNDSVGVGNSNFLNNLGTSISDALSEAVAVGLSNVQYINTGGSVIGIGQATSGGCAATLKDFCNGIAGSTDVFELVGIGDGALNTVGINVDDVIGIGDGVLNSVTSNSFDLIAIGDGALKQCALNNTFTCAVQNLPTPLAMNNVIAIGAVAASFNVGSDVIAMGDFALGSNTVGAATMFGYYNQGTDVIAIGHRTLTINTTGSKNVAIGGFAGADGFVSVASPGNANKTGSNNTWLGYDSGPNTTTQLSNTIALGYQAYNTQSNQTTIGNSLITSLLIFGCPAGQIVYDDGSGTCVTPGGGGTTGMSVNGGGVLANANFNATLPAAAANNINVTWQVTSPNVSAQVPYATSSTFGVVKPDNTTITISGGVISAVGGGTNFGSITTGTNAAATMNCGTGCSILASGSGSITATTMPAAGLTGTTLPVGIVTSSLTTVGTIGTGTWAGTLIAPGHGGTGVANTATLTLGSSNQNWGTLGTGIVKNTTTTGALTIAASADVIALWTGACSSATFLRGDGACVGGGAGDSITSPNSTIVVGGTSTATTLDLAGAAGKIMAGATPALTFTPTLGVASTSTGTLALATSAGSGVVTLGAAVGSIAATVTIPDATDTLVNLTGTQTLTNKSISATEVNSGVLATAQGGTGIANTATLTLGSSNQNWATLGTGIVKNTITTGAISDAASSDVIALWTGSCSSSTFLRGDGACASGGGGDAITSPNATLVVGGTSAATTLDLKGAAGQIMAGATPALTATPTLGASGTVGTLTLGNATSGTVTLGTVAGALGAVTASLPANTGTLAELNLAQTWTALQTFGANASIATTAHGVLVSENTSAVVALSAGTANAPLLSSGASADPAYSTILYPASVSSGGVIYASSTTQLASSVALTSNGVVLGGGAGAAPKVVAGIFTDGTSHLTLGQAGTSIGQVIFANATSGGITVAPPAGALGSVTNTLQAATDTFVYRATTDTLTNKTMSGASNTFTSIPLGGLATQAADTVVMNASGSTQVPTAIAMPTTGTNGCAGASNALTYNTSTHALGCNTISGGGGSGTVNSGTAGHITWYATSGTTVSSDANFDDGATTINTLTYAGTGGMALTAGPLSVSAPAGDSGMISLSGNTVNQVIPTNQFGIAGFTSTGATAYGWQPTSTAPSGTQFMTAGTPSSGWSAINYVSSTGSGNVVLATSPTLVTPVLGAATATSLIASGIVDGEAPVTVTTSASCTLGTTSGCNATAYDSGYTFNQEATAATAITYTLPTAAAGKQYCVSNSYNGSNPTTGTLEILTSASGQFIIFTDGTLSATGGFVQSGGAASDAACVVGVDSTHWQLYVNRGTWTKH